MPTLDVGCGQKRLGDLTIDLVPGPNVDVVHNIAETPWPGKDGKPIPEGTFDELHCVHVLEHLPWDGIEDHESLFQVMAEMHRILKPGGTAYISVPHFLAPSAVGIPTHRRFFNEESFGFFGGSQAGRETRASWDRPLFRSYSYTLEREFKLPGGYTAYHVKKHLPTLWKLCCYLHIGHPGDINAVLVK